MIKNLSKSKMKIRCKVWLKNLFIKIYNSIFECISLFLILFSSSFSSKFFIDYFRHFTNDFLDGILLDMLYPFPQTFHLLIIRDFIYRFRKSILILHFFYSFYLLLNRFSSWLILSCFFTFKNLNPHWLSLFEI